MKQRYSYVEAVKNDAKSAILEAGHKASAILSDSVLKDSVYSSLYDSDSVTGNASGYYTGVYYLPEEIAYLIACDSAQVEKAVRDCGLEAGEIAEIFLSGDYYTIDRITRLYTLKSEYDSILHEMAASE